MSVDPQTTNENSKRQSHCPPERVEAAERPEAEPPKLARAEDASGPEMLAPDWDPDNPYGPTANFTGAGLSNTDPTKSETGGIDTLVVSLYGGWNRLRWCRLQPFLSSVKQVIGGGAPASVSEPITGHDLLIHPAGARLGNGYAKFVFDVAGIRFKLVDRQEHNPRSPSIVVSMGSLALMERGHKAVWALTRELLAGWGFIRERAIPTRVDLCVDHPGVSVKEFVEPVLSGRYVCRGRQQVLYGEKFHRNGRRWTGFSIGKSVHLRIYDKLEELRHASDDRKRNVLLARRWGGVLPEQATRVEFQLRRDILREQFSLDAVDDLYASLGRIANWLTEQWFRLTLSENTGNRPQDLEVAPLWADVSRMFSEWTAGANQPFPLRVVNPPSATRLVKQSAGCLSAALAQMGSTPACGGEAAAYVFDLLEEHFPQIAENTRESRKKLDASRGPLPNSAIPATPDDGLNAA